MKKHEKTRVQKNPNRLADSERGWVDMKSAFFESNRNENVGGGKGGGLIQKLVDRKGQRTVAAKLYERAVCHEALLSLTKRATELFGGDAIEG